MPGVVVQTFTAGASSSTASDYSDQFIVAGQAERGPANVPVAVDNITDFERVFGDFVTYSPLWLQLSTFFQEGGSRAIVSRTVGPAATTGSLTLKDASDVDTIEVEASGPGAWSSNLEVAVAAGTLDDTFRMVVTFNDIVVHDVDNIADPTDAVFKFSESDYVALTDLGSVSVAPNPEALTATALSAGSDDRASITATHYLASLNAITKDYGTGAVAIPGQAGTTIYDGIDDHCKATNRVGILAGARGATSSSLITTAQGLNTEFCGLFAPWVLLADGISAPKVISPEGYVAAARTRAIEETGQWRAGAGYLSEAKVVVGLDQEFDTDEGNQLDAARVNAIRTIAGTTRVYGWRSLALDEANYSFLTYRDFLNLLVMQAEDLLEDYVFQPIDGRGQLVSRIKGELEAMLIPFAEDGGLYPLSINGSEVDPGYSIEVVVPDTNASNEIHATMKVRVSPVGSLIRLSIVKVGTRTPL